MLSHIYNTIYTGINNLISYVYKENKEPSKLKAINQLWLDTYAARKQRTKESLEHPVILLNGDNLTLRYKGGREEIRYVPDEYHELKSLAHISCLIHTMIKLQESKTVGIDVAAKKEEARALLDQIKLPPHLKKYGPLIQKYKTLLEGDDLSQLSELNGSLEELCDEAAKCRLESLHQKTEAIRQKIPEKDWREVSVIVMGPQMPRDGELGMQYYDKVLNLSKQKLQCPYQMQLDNNLSKQRLIYAESIYDEQAALDFLTTHMCDEVLGKDLLGNPEAMHSDVLKNATKKHLLKM